MAKTWRLKKGTTWRQKLEEVHPNHGKTVAIPPGMQKCYGRGAMVIPKPLDVDALMRKVRKGRVITHSRIRSLLAQAAKADHACPFTTGIFIRIAAEAAEEDRKAGRKRITPYWRVVRDNGRLNANFPGGAAAQAARLRKEGLTIEKQRKSAASPPKVKDYEKRLVSV